MNLMQPKNCYYTGDALTRFAGFDYLAIGSGCVECDLTNSTTCIYRMSKEYWEDIQADPEIWRLIAHCDLSFIRKNQPPQSLAGRESDTGE